MIGSKSIKARSILVGLLFISTPGCATAEGIDVDTSSSLPPAIQSSLKPRVVQGRFAFSDRAGKHFLVLSKHADSLADGTRRLSLLATQYVSSGGDWKPEWTIKDGVSCYEVDIEADFAPSLTSVTDLDSDGLAESTVAYQFICAGGVEPKTTKAIMREGKAKFAVRGESLIEIKGTPSFGGTYTADSSLNTKPHFKHHLVSIWKKAAGVAP